MQQLKSVLLHTTYSSWLCCSAYALEAAGGRRRPVVVKGGVFCKRFGQHQAFVVATRKCYYRASSGLARETDTATPNTKNQLQWTKFLHSACANAMQHSCQSMIHDTKLIVFDQKQGRAFFAFQLMKGCTSKFMTKTRRAHFPGLSAFQIIVPYT